MNTSIRIYQTHIEVYPYSKGDSERLEKSLSIYNKAYYRWDAIAYYIANNTLYLPKGISLNLLQREFNSLPIPMPKTDEYANIKYGEILVEPKSSMQKDAIDFLTAEEGFSDYKGKSQFMLNLDTGDGKTVAAIAAILKYGYRAIIITHRDMIKEQWIETLKTKTTVKKRQILDVHSWNIDNILNGKEKERDFYIVNHQTLKAYARNHGWESISELFKKIKVGIKVVDEAHWFFNSTLMIDYYTNTLLSFYLTATFGRAMIPENGIFKKAFYSAARFGEETFNYEDKRKHINLIITYFKSHPGDRIPSVRTKMGFSAYKYIDYELNEEYSSLEYVVKKIIKETSHLEGRTLIISPKIDSADYFANLISNFIGEKVGTVHSANSEETNIKNGSMKYISSTPGSLGAGVNLQGLRVLINLEPMGRISMDQLRGRLREYSDDKETYLFYPVDTSLPDVMSMVKKAMPMFRAKCKKIVALNID